MITLINGCDSTLGRILKSRQKIEMSNNKIMEEEEMNAPVMGGRRRTRKAKKHGKSKKQQGGTSQCGQMGGKRKTRKMSKGASNWNKKVMEVYRELKKKNPATKLGDAMRECSRRKKRGDF
jgi:hypothetical protein